MLDSFLGVLGPGLAAALVLLALTVFVEQAGAARSPEEDGHRTKLSATALWAANVLTPALLLGHAWIATSAREELRLEAMLAPIAAMFGGALLGAMFGAMARGAAPVMRKTALPLALVTLAVTVYAASPSAMALIAR